MDRSSEHHDLAVALAELRQTAREDFVKELDQRAAAGFPRRSSSRTTPLGALADRIRGLAPQRLLLASGSAALAAIAIATVIVAGSDSSTPQIALDSGPKAKQPNGVHFSAPTSRASGQPASAAALKRRASRLRRSVDRLSGSELQVASADEFLNANASANVTPFSGRIHREIERSAQVALLAEPADVADDSAAVFAAVHDARGIVLHSTTTSGKRAGAQFDLLIPSARLGDALAAISTIDEVRSRHEATDDITAPTVTASERLRDSRARIDGLLGQLATAESEAETEALEGDLRRERLRADRFRSQLDKLERRTDFSRVSVRIETGASSTESGGNWGIDDAIGDAGRILAIAAAVTLVGLAIAAPIALIALLAWLAHRLWLRTRRERALDA
jgi:hypothetical protein